MARSINQILAGLKSSLTSFASAVGVTILPNNWSKTDYKSLILNTVATTQGIQEQQFDQVKLDVAEIAKTLPPQTLPWIQNIMINVFEYDAAQVPIVQFDTVNFTPYYPNPNSNFNIIKYCSPKSGGLGTTTIKIAGAGPSAISGSALAAAQTFANFMMLPGLTYNVVSMNADRLFMQLTVYYNGLYSSVIENNIKNALTAFLLNLSTTNFDGIVKVSDLVICVKSVTGVIDVVFDNIQARADSTTVGTGTDLIFNNTELLKEWSMVAGYMILEDTSGANWMLSDYRVGSSGIKNLNVVAV